MLYEAYEKKVRGYLPLARICKICVKCAVLLLIACAVLLLGYLLLRGIHFGDYTLQSETVAFGDKPEYDCFVLLGTYKCEYARPGSGEWMREQPTTPGTYDVRAVITKGLFGKKIYSEVGSVTLYRRELTLRPENKAGAGVAYGESPTFDKHWKISDSLLAKGHYVESAALSYYTYDGRGGAICHIDPSSVVICDKKGNDVTAGYKLSFSQGTVKVKARELTVVVANEIRNGKPVNIEKVYDGESTSTSNYEIVKGNLHKGDVLVVTPRGISADVGRHDNSVVVNVYDSGGQDMTAYYRVKVNACKVIITKRPLTVTTPDVTLEYTGSRQYPDRYTISAGSLAAGQSVSLVHSDKTGALEVTSRAQENRVQLQILSGGRDVTRNYDINYEFGSLTVLPRKLHLQSEDSYGLVYNGREQSWTAYRVLSGSLAPGHFVKAKKAATQTEPGSCENVVEYEIFTSDGKNVTKNYDLGVSYGTLTVQKGAPLRLALQNLEKEYDASALTPAGFDEEKVFSVLAGTLFPGDYLEIVDTRGSQTNVGSSTYSVSYRIMHKPGLGKAVDATDWYASSLAGDGMLTVHKKVLEIRFDPITKQYDGKAAVPDAPDLSNAAIGRYEGKGHRILLAEGAMHALRYSLQGQSVPAAVSVGAYTYTFPEGMLSVVLDDGSGADRTDNYEFRLVGNTIKISGISLTLTAPGSSKQYDGLPLSAEDFSLSQVKETWGADGYRATYTLSGSQTNAGTGTLSVQNVQVWDRDGKNVTSNFEIKTVSGKLTVTPISIQVRSSSGTKMYDGKPLENATQMTLISGQLLPGHVLGGAVKSDYITDVGTHENSRITPKVYASTGQDVSGNYLITVNPGRYTITQAPLEIKSPFVKGEYTGEAYSGTCDATASATGLAAGQSVELEVVSNGIELGVHPMQVVGIRVSDARGQDKSGNYIIDYEDGEIEIVPRKIMVITGSSIVSFDKAPALSTDVRVVEGLLEGHYIRATFTYPDGIYEIGTSATNSLESVRIVNLSGRDVTKYYEIDTSYGMLHVKPIEIGVKTASAYKDVYDGQMLLMPDYNITKGELLDGHVLHVTFKYQSNGPSDVGKWKNELSYIRVSDREGKDVSHMYDFRVTEGILEIAKPYELPMQTFDAQKVYDGEPLSNGEYVLMGELLPGHEIAGAKPVSIELVGEVENRITLIILDANGRDVSRNYAFSYDKEGGMLGVLRVVHRPMTVTVPTDVELTYNGTVKIPVLQEQLLCDGLVAGQKVILPMVVETPEIGAKHACELGDLRIYDARGRDVTHCYYVSIQGEWRTVTVKPAELQLYLPGRYSKEYDGEGVDALQAGYRPMGLAQGHVVEYTDTVTPAEPGQYHLSFTSWTVLDRYGNDVTDNYVIVADSCAVEIMTLYIKLTSASASRHYNGQELICHELLPYTLPAGYTLDAIFTGTQTEVGMSDNVFDVIVYDADGNDITKYCNIAWDFGTLEVWDQIPLTLQSGSATGIYDGLPLVCHQLGKYELPEGYRLEVVFTGEQIEPGESENTFEVTIYDSVGEDVTESFAITKQCGTLTIKRAEDWVIVLRSESATKNYDGKALTCPMLEPYELPRGFYLDVTFTGEQTELGQSANTFTARVYNDAGQELTVAYEYGTLEVVLEITVNAYEMTYTYDGTEKNCEDVWVQGLPEGYRVEVEFGEGLRETGSKDVEFESVRVFDEHGNDVTEMCTLTKKSAKLTVLPRTLTVYVYGQSAGSITPVQGELVDGHVMFAEYGEGGECYIEIADESGELVYSNHPSASVRIVLYEVIIQYG